jgi:hypothetical protein
MQSLGNKMNLFIVDACRYSPFMWSRSATNCGLSLAGVQPSTSVIFYVTSAGSVAQDCERRNEIFTSEPLKNIETPGIDIDSVLNRTGSDE